MKNEINVIIYAIFYHILKIQFLNEMFVLICIFQIFVAKFTNKFDFFKEIKKKKLQILKK